MTATQRDESQPLPILVRHYGQTYADSYRAAYDALPAGQSEQQRHVRGEVAHWYAVHQCRPEYVHGTRCQNAGTFAAYATGYAEQQTAGACGNARAAREYAALSCEQVTA